MKYAILSHTWTIGEEVQFDEFQTVQATGKQGWIKINKICELALESGIDFVWCDTCCINKTSSAELTEAINSMFSWYSKAEICYVYLDDYDASSVGPPLSSCKWFTRGWTLQELIAPPRILFFDKSWTLFGTKHILCEQLSTITGIETESLLAAEQHSLDQHLGQISLGRRMAWAAKRETTRVEDLAYCLLGIFGVNLPLLYGEGEHAFIRLQEEILKSSNDLSLLAWRLTEEQEDYGYLNSYCGVLARHPKYFRNSDDIFVANHAVFAPDFIMTNKGIKIETGLRYSEEAGLHVLDVNCYSAFQRDADLGIFLKHRGASVFARALPQRLTQALGTITNQRYIFLSKALDPGTAASLDKVHRFSFLFPEIDSEGSLRKTVRICPGIFWDSGQRVFITAGLQNFVGYAEVSVKSAVQSRAKAFFMMFGFGYGFGHWAKLLMADHNEMARAIMQKNWQAIAKIANDQGVNELETHSGVDGHGKRAKLFQNLVSISLDSLFTNEVAYFVVNHQFYTRWSKQ